MEIRKFNISDAEEISKLVCRNLLEVNSKEYGMDDMIQFAKEYDYNKIIKVATSGHMYIVQENNKILGCGAISFNNIEKTESIILTLFVLPEYHGKGIGKKIIEVIEQDEIYLNSEKIVVSASLSSNIFYEKMGFIYKNNLKEPSPQKCYYMEKNNLRD